MQMLLASHFGSTIMCGGRAGTVAPAVPFVPVLTHRTGRSLQE